MKRKIHCPISGIPKGSKTFLGPYRGPGKKFFCFFGFFWWLPAFLFIFLFKLYSIGKYHHRRDLLFVPRWGRQPKKTEFHSPIPTGSGLRWQQHVHLAWPLKETPLTERLYYYNERRYLTPALKANNNSVRNYLLNQLDPSKYSGIGLFNVKWGNEEEVEFSKKQIEGRTRALLSEDDINNLPEGLSKHLVAFLNQRHPEILKDLIKPTIPRQK